jgi:hypothetical protein
MNWERAKEPAFWSILVGEKIHNFNGVFFLLLGFKVWFDVYAYFRSWK